MGSLGERQQRQPDDDAPQPDDDACRFRFRPARPGDADAIAACNIAMAAETESLTLAPEVVGAGVRAVLAGQQALGARYFVLEEQQQGDEGEQEQAGEGEEEEGRGGEAGQHHQGEGGGGAVVAQLMITTEFSDWRNKLVWWIQSVYVAPQHRRKGLFRRLYAQVRAEAAAAGAAGLRLYADDGNASAHKTYESLGMSSHYRVFEEMFC